MASKEETRMDNIEIRSMKISDLKQVMGIERAVFSHPWPAEAFISDLLSTRPCHYIVAVEGSKVLGYAGAHLEKEKFHLVNMAVRKSSQRQGVGSLLMDRMVGIAGEKDYEVIYLEVRENNQAACVFYRRNGFIEKEIRENYYSDTGEDAIIMVRRIEDDEK